jgi:hypothetical protein
MNKIIVDMSEWNDIHDCELIFKMPNGLTIEFPRVYIDELNHTTLHDIDCIDCARDKDKYGNIVGVYYNKSIKDIHGKFSFIPLTDDDGVQYREIREVKA